MAEHAAYLAARGHDVEVIAAGSPSSSTPSAPVAGAGSLTVARLGDRLFDGAGAPEAFDAVPFMDLMREYGSPWGMTEMAPST